MNPTEEEEGRAMVKPGEMPVTKSVWEIKQKERVSEALTNSEPDWQQKDFFLPRKSSSLPLCSAFPLLSNPSLVAPTFLMKTLHMQNKNLSIWEGVGGLYWGGDSDLRSAMDWSALKDGKSGFTFYEV